MSKRSLMWLSGLVVCGAAVAAIITSQSALAQQRARTDSGAVLISNRRIVPSDPTFKWAVAAVIDPVKERVIGHNWKADMPGAFVFSETIKEHQSGTDSWFHKNIFWLPPDKGDIRAKEMTPAELALAETLFMDMDLSKAKNLAVTRDGIVGSVTAQELGVRPGELVAKTRTRLANQMRMHTAAQKELGQ